MNDADRIRQNLYLARHASTNGGQIELRHPNANAPDIRDMGEADIAHYNRCLELDPTTANIPGYPSRIERLPHGDTVATYPKRQPSPTPQDEKLKDCGERMRSEAALPPAPPASPAGPIPEANGVSKRFDGLDVSTSPAFSVTTVVDPTGKRHVTERSHDTEPTKDVGNTEDER